MKKMTEIQVSIEDKPGTMATLCSVLGKAGVNIVGSMVTGGVVRMVVQDVPKATSALNGAGYKSSTKEVAAAELPNQPGALTTLARKIADKGVNIDYLYATTMGSGGNATVVFGVANPDAIAGL